MKKMKRWMAMCLAACMLMGNGGIAANDAEIMPAAAPAAAVTAVPTAEPTAEVTVEPTAEPTAEVTVEPTAVPELGMEMMLEMMIGNQLEMKTAVTTDDYFTSLPFTGEEYSVGDFFVQSEREPLVYGTDFTAAYTGSGSISAPGEYEIALTMLNDAYVFRSTSFMLRVERKGLDLTSQFRTCPMMAPPIPVKNLWT